MSCNYLLYTLNGVFPEIIIITTYLHDQGKESNTNICVVRLVRPEQQWTDFQDFAPDLVEAITAVVNYN